MTNSILSLDMIKDKDAYSIDDNITINVKFSLGGDIRNSFNEKNWTDAWNNNDNQFKLKYGVKLNSGGLRKHDVGKPIDTYRKASIFWTRNPKLVNPVKEKRIWVQVAKNFEPYIKLTEEDVQKELDNNAFDLLLDELKTKKSQQKIGAEVFASWNKHDYTDGDKIKLHSKEIEIDIN